MRHLRRLWGSWWLLPGAVPLAYVLGVTLAGDFRPEHAGVVVVAWFFAYASQATRRFFLAVAPYLSTAMLYDAVRYPRALLVTADRVLGCGLRKAELVFFSVAPDTTLQDWFAVHHAPALDVVCAIPYLLFAYVVLGYAIYLYFVDRARMQRFVWAYALGNLMSFVCWLGLPSAPPWYLREHGCVIDLAVVPSPAGLQRVDDLFGMGYFRAFYSRAASAFGALPSMHCAFPLMGLLVSWRVAGWRTRPIHLAYTLLMAFAAVYLDHHWVLDAIAGWCVALVSVMMANRLCVRLPWLGGEQWSSSPLRTSPSNAEGGAP
jgi:inositol phosphorylceramide synthase catalytic subunit